MAKKSRPIKWLEDATPQEIGEALLAVDEIKAGMVVTYLGSRIGSEVGRVVEDIKIELNKDPVGSIARGIMGIARGKRK